MSRRFLASLTILSFSCAYANAQIIVNETFDDYADQAAFEAVWRPDEGSGNAPSAESTGILVPRLDFGLIPPYDSPPGLEGKGVNMLNNINEYVGPATLNLLPTETQAIRLSVDFFDSPGTEGVNSANRRASAGLRSKAGPANLIEIGFWNANTSDPFDPDDPPAEIAPTSYAYRTALFPPLPPDSPLARAPNWGYFELDPILDVSDPLDGRPNVTDIGEGWHRFTATISLTEVTFTLDLWRDGLANTSRTPDSETGIRPGTPGVDASVTLPIGPNLNFPFDSLRIGTPSGGTGNAESVVDNVVLELIDITPPEGNADFDGDGFVDGHDLLIWQRNFGTLGGANHADGDANLDGNIDGADLAIWESQFGTTPGAIAAVPEPGSIALMLLALAGVSMRRVR